MDDPMRGRWNTDFFEVNRPIVLELGCGKGEYTTGLAERFPDKNFLGVDIKGNRIWKGARRVAEAGIPNAGFLRTKIEFLHRIFAPGEVDEIWITFPDPQPKKPSKRLTSSGFLNLYRQIIHRGGLIHLKTDSRMLYLYTGANLLENGIVPLLDTPDLYGSGYGDELLSIRTYYEQGFLEEGRKITYLRFTLPTETPVRETRRYFQ